MKRLTNVGRALALIPLLTACVTMAGGNPEDDTLPPQTPDESVSETFQEKSAPIPSSGSTDAGQDDREQPTETEAASDRQRTAGDTGSTGDGPLQNVPLVIDLSDLTDPDGLGTPSVQWQEYDANRGTWTKIDGATTQTFTPRQRHVGNRLRVALEYLDGGGNLESIVTQPTPPVRNVNDPPMGELGLVGTQAQYETLRADISEIRDEDGIGPITYFWEISPDGNTWQRYRQGEWQGDTITLTQDEVGRYLRAVIRYADGYGAAERVNSPATDPIRNVNDPVQGELLIRGDTLVGDTLEVDTSAVSDRDGIANVTLVWEASDDGRSWRRAAETSTRTLELTRNLVGAQIRARANVVDQFGNEGTVVSSIVGPVEAVNEPPSGTIRILSVD
ncbi:hypothetical protein BA899_07435 [Spiribacter sp. SSL99]|uniref:hypothetical protein n=1 Tax=Spiribacter sp. SSL99 TaxID=1866884 RepID=UPI0013301928|nr:hypothetical protein [Spiribacter sp. SSL99]KAF0284934.1 hypothetical protein BA899_07435 [Spiribacter sp. SSL99]